MDQRELGLRRSAAAALAREAGEIAWRRFSDRGSFTVGFKGPQDFLTEVDGEVERFVAARLLELFPGDGFIGEEGEGREPHGDAPTWVVDPIDGTSNFARGAPYFCVSIGLARGGEAIAGAIYDPARGELFSAAKGQGATLNGAAMRVSDIADLRQAAVEVGWNMRSPAASFVDLLGIVAAGGSAVLRCGSGALALAYVAAGRRDAYVEHHINSWDCLAGNVLVVEAGGYVSDFLANDGLRKGNALLACAPGVREAMLKIASQAGVKL